MAQSKRGLETLKFQSCFPFFLLFIILYTLSESNDLRVTIIYLSLCTVFGFLWYRQFRAKALSYDEIGNFQWVFIAMIIIGICAALAYTYHSPEINQDGMRNVTMGETFLEHGDFKEYFRVTDSYEWSHRYSPMLPLYLALVIAPFGTNVWALKTASVLLFLFAVFIAYWCTKRMYGKAAGYLAAGVCAIIPRLWESTANMQTECMALAFYIMIIFFILKSLEEKTEHYIIYAGIFAGIGYLTRSSIGYFFIIAGLLGFLWRFYYMRWGVFKNRSYIIAIICFLTIVAIWAIRNLYRFWDGTFGDFFVAWQTDIHLSKCLAIAFSQPLLFLFVLAVKLCWLFLLLAPWLLYHLTPVSNLRRLILDERISGLALAIFIPIVLGAFISVIFTLGEGYAKNPIFNFDNNRYIIISIIPLFWYGLDVWQINTGKRALAIKS